MDCSEHCFTVSRHNIEDTATRILFVLDRTHKDMAAHFILQFGDSLCYFPDPIPDDWVL
jgi:hypothetical protein